MARPNSENFHAEVALEFIQHAQNYLIQHYLPKIKGCLEQLTDEQIWWRGNDQSNSIGNLVLHLCGNARQWIIAGVGQQPDVRRRNDEFSQTEAIPKQQLLELLMDTLHEIKSVLSALDSSTLLERRTIQGLEVNVLEAIFHVTEHFSMHTGQIILLTKLLTAKDLRFYDFKDKKPVLNWLDDSTGPRST